MLAGQPLYVILGAKESSTVLGYDKAGSAHAVAIKTINVESNSAILIDSNEPNKSIEVDLDILLNSSRIFGF